MNKWKVFGYTVVTWLAFSVLAKLYVSAMQQRIPEYSIYDGALVIWSWMSLIMGIFMAARLRSWIEILWGILFFVLCLVPFSGVFFGIGYFVWCYTKLERKRTVKSDEARALDQVPSKKSFQRQQPASQAMD